MFQSWDRGVLPVASGYRRERKIVGEKNERKGKKAERRYFLGYEDSSQNGGSQADSLLFAQTLRPLEL